MIKKRLLALCSSMILLSGLLSGCSLNQNTETAAQTTQESSYNEVTVTKGNVEETLSISGSLVTKAKDTITSTTNSTVEKIYVSQNDEVSEGDYLVLMENGRIMKAPYDGMITKIDVSKGDDVTNQTELMNIVDNSKYYIKSSIDESDISKVKVGQAANITVSALDKEYTGKITFISSEATVSGDRATFDLTITLKGDCSDLYYGLSAEADIILNSATDALLIPINAVSVSNGKKTVMVKNGDSFTEQEVTLGVQDSSYVEVLSGLNENDVVKFETKQSSKNKDSMGNFDFGSMPGGGSMPQGGGMPQGDFQKRPQGNNQK